MKYGQILRRISDKFRERIWDEFLEEEFSRKYGLDSLVKLYIFQINRSLTLDQKRHYGREHS